MLLFSVWQLSWNTKSSIYLVFRLWHCNPASSPQLRPAKGRGGVMVWLLFEPTKESETEFFILSNSLKPHEPFAHKFWSQIVKSKTKLLLKKEKAKSFEIKYCEYKTYSNRPHRRRSWGPSVWGRSTRRTWRPAAPWPAARPSRGSAASACSLLQGDHVNHSPQAPPRLPM